MGGGFIIDRDGRSPGLAFKWDSLDANRRKQRVLDMRQDGDVVEDSEPEREQRRHGEPAREDVPTAL